MIYSIVIISANLIIIIGLKVQQCIADDLEPGTSAFPDIIVWPDALYQIQLKPTNISFLPVHTHLCFPLWNFPFSLFRLLFFFALPIFPSFLPCLYFFNRVHRWPNWGSQRGYISLSGWEDLPRLITLYPTNASAHALAFLLQQFPFSLRKGIFGETQLLFNWEI